MSNMNNWDDVYANFERAFPSFAEEVVDWWPSGRFEITMKLTDGSRIRYDNYANACKLISSLNAGSDISDETRWRIIFARRLRDHMTYAGITQKELAELTGISVQSLSKYANGTASPSAYNIAKIARVLNCSPSTFIDCDA